MNRKEYGLIEKYAEFCMKEGENKQKVLAKCMREFSEISNKKKPAAMRYMSSKMILSGLYKEATGIDNRDPFGDADPKNKVDDNIINEYLKKRLPKIDMKEAEILKETPEVPEKKIETFKCTECGGTYGWVLEYGESSGVCCYCVGSYNDGTKCPGGTGKRSDLIPVKEEKPSKKERL